MSDAIKWALLAAALALIIGMIVALPLGVAIDIGEATDNIGTIVRIIATPLYYVRAFINCFLTPMGRVILSGLIYYIMFKWIYTTGISAIANIYHFIFK